MSKLLSNNRKKYMEKMYSKYWINAREKIYGFSLYDRNLIKMIKNNSEGVRILEVAVGTGYPFADYFCKCGWDIYGIDISPLLIEKCQSEHPCIKCKIADAEDLPFSDNFFDTVYCFHSSWYFPDIMKAISEMIRVVKPRGEVFFDIQNLNNISIKKAYFKRLGVFN